MDAYFRMMMMDIFGPSVLLISSMPIEGPKDYYFWLGREAEDLFDE